MIRVVASDSFDDTVSRFSGDFDLLQYTSSPHLASGQRYLTLWFVFVITYLTRVHVPRRWDLLRALLTHIREHSSNLASHTLVLSLELQTRDSGLAAFIGSHVH